MALPDQIHYATDRFQHIHALSDTLQFKQG